MSVALNHAAILLIVLGSNAGARAQEYSSWDDVILPLRNAFDAFDRGSGVTTAILAVGILSSCEQYKTPNTLLPLHLFGKDQCEDPTLDALSFIECNVARARTEFNETFKAGGDITMRNSLVMFDRALETYISGCQGPFTSLWHTGQCMGSCSACADQERQRRQTSEKDVDTTASSNFVSSRESGTTILISSDWHVEPWYLSDAKPKCGGNDDKGKICRFQGGTDSNMFSCRDNSRKVVKCNLDGNRDPPVELIESHIASR
jgi:hypothetical protein